LPAAAAGLVGEHDMSAARDTLHPLADLFHYTRALMTQHHRHVGRVPVFADVDIGMTDARSDEAHQNLVVSRTFQFERLDLQGAALLAQNSGVNLVHLHVGTMSQCSIPLCVECFLSSLKPLYRPAYHIMQQPHESRIVKSPKLIVSDVPG
jgi:hypothetical protein